MERVLQAELGSSLESGASDDSGIDRNGPPLAAPARVPVEGASDESLGAEAEVVSNEGGASNASADVSVRAILLNGPPADTARRVGPAEGLVRDAALETPSDVPAIDGGSNRWLDPYLQEAAEELSEYSELSGSEFGSETNDGSSGLDGQRAVVAAVAQWEALCGVFEGAAQVPATLSYAHWFTGTRAGESARAARAFVGAALRLVLALRARGRCAPRVQVAALALVTAVQGLREEHYGEAHCGAGARAARGALATAERAAPDLMRRHYGSLRMLDGRAPREVRAARAAVVALDPGFGVETREPCTAALLAVLRGGSANVHPLACLFPSGRTRDAALDAALRVAPMCALARALREGGAGEPALKRALERAVGAHAAPPTKRARGARESGASATDGRASSASTDDEEPDASARALFALRAGRFPGALAGAADALDALVVCLACVAARSDGAAPAPRDARTLAAALRACSALTEGQGPLAPHVRTRARAKDPAALRAVLATLCRVSCAYVRREDVTQGWEGVETSADVSGGDPEDEATDASVALQQATISLARDCLHDVEDTLNLNWARVPGVTAAFLVRPLWGRWWPLIRGGARARARCAGLPWTLAGAVYAGLSARLPGAARGALDAAVWARAVVDATRMYTAPARTALRDAAQGYAQHGSAEQSLIAATYLFEWGVAGGSVQHGEAAASAGPPNLRRCYELLLTADALLLVEPVEDALAPYWMWCDALARVRGGRPAPLGKASASVYKARMVAHTLAHALQAYVRATSERIKGVCAEWEHDDTPRAEAQTDADPTPDLRIETRDMFARVFTDYQELLRSLQSNVDTLHWPWRVAQAVGEALLLTNWVAAAGACLAVYGGARAGFPEAYAHAPATRASPQHLWHLERAWAAREDPRAALWAARSRWVSAHRLYDGRDVHDYIAEHLHDFDSPRARGRRRGSKPRRATRKGTRSRRAAAAHEPEVEPQLTRDVANSIPVENPETENPNGLDVSAWCGGRLPFLRARSWDDSLRLLAAVHAGARTDGFACDARPLGPEVFSGVRAALAALFPLLESAARSLADVCVQEGAPDMPTPRATPTKMQARRTRFFEPISAEQWSEGRAPGLSEDPRGPAPRALHVLLDELADLQGTHTTALQD